jgi:hypothetical protein
MLVVVGVQLMVLLLLFQVVKVEEDMVLLVLDNPEQQI